MQKKEKKPVKWIILEIDPQEHHEIKKRAVERNITMKQYILQAIEQRIKYERKYE
jgi:predicted HicB family RNase H-like nuclease